MRSKRIRITLKAAGALIEINKDATGDLGLPIDAREPHTYAAAWGPDGPLVRRGLIAAPAAVRARSAATIAGEIPLDPAALR